MARRCRRAGRIRDTRERRSLSVAPAPAAPALRDRVAALLDSRLEANRRFFDAESERLARLCHQMAERFARGGRLVALGVSPSARSDVRHVTVEFVHPVIVGKRALPAIGLYARGRPARRTARPRRRARRHRDRLRRRRARGRGGRRRGRGGARDRLPDDGLRARRRRVGARGAGGDPYVRQELAETAYHVLWELVHVFFDHRGLLSGPRGRARPRHGPLELPLSLPLGIGESISRPSSRTCAQAPL